MGWVGPAIGLATGIAGLFKKGNKNVKALGELSGKVGQFGYGELGKASGLMDTLGTRYEEMYTNPEVWTAGTAADMARNVQSQAGMINRNIGRSGIAGAGLSELYSKNQMANLANRLGARQYALGAMQQLAGQRGQLGLGATGQGLQGMEGAGALGLRETALNRDFGMGIGQSVYDIFTNSKDIWGQLGKRGGTGVTTAQDMAEKPWLYSLGR